MHGCRLDEDDDGCINLDVGEHTMFENLVIDKVYPHFGLNKHISSWEQVFYLFWNILGLCFADRLPNTKSLIFETAHQAWKDPGSPKGFHSAYFSNSFFGASFGKSPGSLLDRFGIHLGSKVCPNSLPSPDFGAQDRIWDPPVDILVW